MKHLFVGGPWDGRVEDIARLTGVEPGPSGVRPVSVPVRDGELFEVKTYYPRKYRWATERGGVQIEVMAWSMSEPLAGPLLLHLFRLAGLDVIWGREK